MKHIHKYVKVKNKSHLSSKIFFKCALDGCVHKVEKPFALGRFSICNRCDKQFVLDVRALDLAKPHCPECTKSTKQENVTNIANLVEKLGI